MTNARKEIYLGDALRRVLEGRQQSLTTVVNTMADRYQGLLDRIQRFPCTLREEDVYRAVVAESRGRPLESHDIAVFPQRVHDWLVRNPDFPMSAYARVNAASFVELVALIDYIERNP